MLKTGLSNVHITNVAIDRKTKKFNLNLFIESLDLATWPLANIN